MLGSRGIFWPNVETRATFSPNISRDSTRYNNKINPNGQFPPFISLMNSTFATDMSQILGGSIDMQDNKNRPEPRPHDSVFPTK